MRYTANLLALLSALAVAACADGQSMIDRLNSGPPDTGPGCYDHKGRLERTITTRAECDHMTWVWKP